MLKHELPGKMKTIVLRLNMDKTMQEVLKNALKSSQTNCIHSKKFKEFGEIKCIAT